MKILRLFLIFCFLFSIMSWQGFSQEDVLRPKIKPKTSSSEGSKSYMYFLNKIPISIGIEGGVNFNFFNEDMTWTPALDNPPGLAYKSGTGLSPYVGLIIDVGLNNKMGIQLKLDYDKKYFKNSHTGIADYLQGMNVTQFDEYLEYDVTQSYIDVDLLFRYNFTPNLIFTVGPVFQFASSDSMNQNVKWNAIDQSIPVNSEFNDIKNPVNTFRFGLDAGLGYRINLNRKLWLMPNIRFQYLFTKFAESNSDIDVTRAYSIGNSFVELTNKNLYSIQFGVALMFDIQ